MPDYEFIADQRLVALRPSGETVDIVVAVGIPRQVGPDEWACPGWVSGLEVQAHEHHGGTSLQALCLALMYVRRELTFFIEDGGRLQYPGTGDDFNDIALAATFGVGDLG